MMSRDTADTAALRFSEWASLFSSRMFLKIVAYIDESGIDAKSSGGPVTVAGLIGWRDQWETFCRNWRGVLQKYDVTYFHFREWATASAVAHGRRDLKHSEIYNPFLKLDTKQLDEFLLELAQIIGSSKQPSISGTAFIRDLKKLGKPGQPLGIYDTCAETLFREFPYDLKLQWPFWENESVAFVFDHCSDPEWEPAVARAYHKYRAQDSRIGELIFADKKREPHLPLQAADMMAYRMRHIREKLLKMELPKRWLDLNIDKTIFTSLRNVLQSNPSL